MMKVYGYQKECEDLLNLKEVSILCNINELEKIISFLKDVKKEHEGVIDETDMCHSHYRDWDEKWKKGSPDLIIVTKK